VLTFLTGKLDCTFNPGVPIEITLTGPDGWTTGRTFAAALGATPITTTVTSATVLTVTATPAQTTDIVGAVALTVSDTTPSTDVVIIRGVAIAAPGVSVETPDQSDTVHVILPGV